MRCPYICGPARALLGASAISFLSTGALYAQAPQARPPGDSLGPWANASIAVGVLTGLGGILKIWLDARSNDQTRTIKEQAATIAGLNDRLTREVAARHAADAKATEERQTLKDSLEFNNQVAQDRIQRLEWEKEWQRIQLARRANIIIPPAPPVGSPEAQAALTASGTFPAQDDDDCKASVLIVEDSVSDASLLQRVLSTYGYKSRAVPSVEDALASLKDRHPDFIILDLGLVGCDGDALLKAVKGDKVLRDIRVIISTGCPDEARMKVLDLQADRVFKKPYDPRSLIGWLDEAVEASWPPPR